MAIWEYPTPERSAARISWFLRKIRFEMLCPFCDGVALKRWVNKYDRTISNESLGGGLDSMLASFQEGKVHVRRDINDYVLACSSCGWWCAVKVIDTDSQTSFDDDTAPMRRVLGTSGTMLALSDSDISAPLDEARHYLGAKFDDARSAVDPKVFEMVVASVLKDMGYRPRVTSQTTDKGLDIILDGPDDSIIGVQVKRYKNAIELEQLNSLVGALVRRGYTRGVFVTTSRFQSGFAKAVTDFAGRGFAIELVDANKFLDALQIGIRQMYHSQDELLNRYGEDLIELGEWNLYTSDPETEVWF